jgi:phosphodiesterase/alkaline phosphatase D-like protein
MDSFIADASPRIPGRTIGDQLLEGSMRLRSCFLLLVLPALAVAGRTANAQIVTSNSVQLSWTTTGDDSLTGTASQFDLRYATFAITSANFASATRWVGTPTPGPAGTRHTTTVTGLSPSTTYWFAIKTADDVPNWSAISNIISRATLAAPDTVRPAQVATVAITGTTETTAALRWTAVGDDSLTGTATTSDVRYSTSPITAANWASATQATGEPAPAVSGTVQNFTVTGLSRQTTYYFAMKVGDEAGNLSALSNVPSVTTPDQTRPAAITDLVVGFVWLGGTPAWTTMVLPPAQRHGRHRS